MLLTCMIVLNMFEHDACFAHTLQLVIKDLFKVVSSEFYFHKPITVHIELYLFYHFIHFLLYIG